MPSLRAFPGIIHRGAKSPARTSFGVVRFLHMRDDQPQRAAGIDIAEFTWGFMVHQAEPLRVHHLNNTASAILELCDGHATVAEIADGVADAFNLEAPPLAEVAACVADLRRIGVLADAFSGRRIILFRFHDQFDGCRERLRILRHFNPDVPIYGLYGGPSEGWDDARECVEDAVVHLHMWSAVDPTWKWMHAELAVKEWFRTYGHAIAFDLLYEYEYDMLMCAPLRELYPPLPANGLAFSAVRTTESMANRWMWITHEAYRPGYLAFCDYLAERYGVASIDQVVLGPGPLLTRRFLTEFCELEDCDLVHNELSYPAFAQALGFTLVDNRLYSEESERLFHCYGGSIEWKHIEAELGSGPRRAFHPVKYQVTLEQVLSAVR
jgi:Coenzyme PQQ synthesis protein D (PqqD)